MYNYDLHVHTYRCKHAFGDFEEYVCHAIKNDIKILGFTDHCPFSDNRWINFRMYWEELDGYISQFNVVKQKYKDQIKLILGLECEYVPGCTAGELDVLSQEYGIQYFSFGAHFLPFKGDWLNTYEDMKSSDHVIAYFDYLISAAESGLFQFICHPDIFEYGNYSYELIEDAMDQFLDVCESNNTVLELNSSSIYKKNRIKKNLPLQPNTYFWKKVAQHDIDIVINSDAHYPPHVNKARKQCIEFADQLGIRIISPQQLFST